MSRFSKLVSGTIAASVFAVMATSAFAQLGELKLIAPAAPGGGWDQTARAMQSALVASGAAKNVQVTNIPGAGGTVGLAQFVTSKDPNTMMVNGFVMVGAILLNKSPVSLDQVTPIAKLTEETVVVVVNADSPIKSAKDLAAAIKADVSKVTFAGGSAGSVDHILAAQIVKAAGADPAKVNYIPFSGGGESIAAVLGGKVTAGISGYAEYEGQIKAGKMRALGISSEKKMATIPVPTLKEQGLDAVITNWRSVVAAPGISADDKKKLADAVDKMVKSDAWKEVLKQKGWDDAYMSGDEFAKFLKTEQARVSEVMKTIGLVKS
ncbi:MAG TPA: tripartite tricarboxylate transporter substrate-binding protein [Xanthobacteraceae bacterium]|jgi:putative tricarboxylic transport membrane protein|nr:tripartite tricarboxylate transporter substrate-binding protein [Xanthobacteraceae bacterium]